MKTRHKEGTRIYVDERDVINPPISGIIAQVPNCFR